MSQRLTDTENSSTVKCGATFKEHCTFPKCDCDRNVCTTVLIKGDIEHLGFSVTDPTHGGKVTCANCSTFLDEGLPYWHDRTNNIWFCYNCGEDEVIDKHW